MKALKLSPVLYTTELRETVDFYCTKLDFNVINLDEQQQWALLQNGDVQIMMSYPNEHLDYRGAEFSGSFYIEVDDIHALWQRIATEAEVVYEPEDFEWGMREFAIRDNNGYILQFGQEL